MRLRKKTIYGYFLQRKVVIWRAVEEGMNVVIVNPSFIIGPGDTNKGSSEAFGILRKRTAW